MENLVFYINVWDCKENENHKYKLTTIEILFGIDMLYTDTK